MPHTSLDVEDTDVNLDWVLPLWYSGAGNKYINESICEVISHNDNVVKKIKEQAILFFFVVFFPHSYLMLIQKV